MRALSAALAAEIGARPRFVCKITPVALITGMSDGASRASARSAMRDSIAPGSSAAAEALDGSFLSCSRNSASTARADWVTTPRPAFSASAERCGRARTSSTDGISRRRADSPCCSFATGSTGGLIAKLFEHSTIRLAIAGLFRFRPGISLWDKPRHGKVDAPPAAFYAGESHYFAMATIDEDLNQIERDVRSLKIEYEQFFGGGRSRPPTDTQWRVDTLVRRYAERVAQLNSGQRFRYNNLTQTYAKYQDLWRKKLMQKEGAVSLKHFGAAAKAIEAQRAREESLRQKVANAEPPAAAAQHSTVPAADLAAAEAMARAKAARDAAVFALSFSGPEHEKSKVQQLYRKLIEARAAAGDKASAPSLKDFERFVLQKTMDLKNKGGHEIEYTVTVEAGRVKLKARISS